MPLELHLVYLPRRVNRSPVGLADLGIDIGIRPEQSTSGWGKGAHRMYIYIYVYVYDLSLYIYVVYIYTYIYIHIYL